MTRIDWLKNKLVENNLDYKLIQDTCYEDYCEIFNTSIELKSFKDTVKNAYNTLKVQKSNDVDEEYDIENTIKLEKNAQKRSDVITYLKRNNRNEYRLLNYTESLYEELIKKLDNVSFNIPTIKEVKPCKEKGLTGLMIASDWHFGTLIFGKDESESYDFNIANKRVKKYVDKSIQVMKNNNVDTVVLGLLGDLVSSVRRNDEKLGCVSSQTNTCLIVVTILEQVLVSLCNNFSKVILTGIVGNESRLTDDMEWHNNSLCSSWDWMILTMLKHIMKDKIKNLEIRVPENPIKELIEIPINNGTYNVCIAHGNLTKRLKDDCEKVYTRSYIEEENKRVNLTVFGHYHQTLCLSSGKLLVAGSLMRNNVYAKSVIGVKGHAFQTLVIIQNDGSYWSLPMKLDDVSDIKEGYKIQDELNYMSYNNATNVNAVDIKITYN